VVLAHGPEAFPAPSADVQEIKRSRSQQGADRPPPYSADLHLPPVRRDFPFNWRRADAPLSVVGAGPVRAVGQCFGCLRPVTEFILRPPNAPLSPFQDAATGPRSARTTSLTVVRWETEDRAQFSYLPYQVRRRRGRRNWSATTPNPTPTTHRKIRVWRRGQGSAAHLPVFDRTLSYRQVYREPSRGTNIPTCKEEALNVFSLPDAAAPMFCPGKVHGRTAGVLMSTCSKGLRRTTCANTRTTCKQAA